MAQHARADGVPAAPRWTHCSDELRVDQLPVSLLRDSRGSAGLRDGDAGARDQRRRVCCQMQPTAKTDGPPPTHPTTPGLPERAGWLALVPAAVVKPLPQQLKRGLRKVALALRLRGLWGGRYALCLG